MKTKKQQLKENIEELPLLKEDIKIYENEMDCIDEILDMLAAERKFRINLGLKILSIIISALILLVLIIK